jgi:colicin import membrane protein
MKTSPGLDVFYRFSQNPRIAGMVFLSFTLHFAAISAMFLLPNLSSSRIYYSPVYSVRLVSAPPSPGPVVQPMARPEAKAPAPESPPAVEPPKAKPKERSKPVSLNPVQKDTDEQKIAGAIERIRQRKESESVDTAIERLRSEKDSRQLDSAIERIRKRVTIGSAGAVETGESGTGGASSGVMSIKFKIYYNLLWQRIRSVWVLPEEALGGKKNLETIIAIRIARDGQIEDIQFEKKSGNPYLDESAIRAIKKANPLPPLPSDIEGDKFDVGVRFTPSDL